jgi:hypothetical protein
MTKITRSGEYTEKPTDMRIFGCFIESGFGRQVSGMWSEMLYNRAFRVVPEYKRATWDWLGLDKEHYKSDAPFWHSGYEEHDWYWLGKPRIWRTCGSETFKGTTSLVVDNRAGGECGAAQDGIHLEAGREYVFTVFCGASVSRSDPGLNGFGDSVRPAEPKPLKISVGGQSATLDVYGVPKAHEWCFTARETGVFTLSITFDWRGGLILAAASLMPADTLDGWRRDVVELMREAGPTVVRFPGGCFTSFYNWESSIGPRDEREPQESYYWGGLEENDVGLDEFLRLSQLVGFEPQICFNMMTSTPFRARCMVEYLNAPQNAGYGRARMLNGHAEPYGVRLFECDNEPSRKWSAEQYAHKCVEFAREMRLADPNIEFMMAAYSYGTSLLPYMLDIAGGDVDYVIYRDGDPEFVARVMPVIEAYNKKTGRNLRLVNTEWLPSCHSPEPFDEPCISMTYGWDGVIYNDYDKVFSRHQISWNYALNGAHRLLDYISYGGGFALANFNNMTNTWGQNIIEASKDGAWLSCMGEVFAFFKKHFKTCTAAPADTGNPLVFAMFTRSADGEDALYVINHGSVAAGITLPDGYSAAGEGLTAPRRSSHVTESDRCVRKIGVGVKNSEAELPPLSLVLFARV